MKRLIFLLAAICAIVAGVFADDVSSLESGDVKTLRTAVNGTSVVSHPDNHAHTQSPAIFLVPFLNHSSPSTPLTPNLHPNPFTHTGISRQEYSIPLS
jgi:hypothetical protein